MVEWQEELGDIKCQSVCLNVLCLSKLNNVSWKHVCIRGWLLFKNAIYNCKNLSALGLDKISWRILKWIINDNVCLISIVNIANTCINLEYWPLHFKSSMLWQPLITKTNDHTSGKSLKLDIKWEVHKRTWQGVSAKLESYIY